MNEPSFWRHAAFVGPGTLDGVVTIIGCGATGSHIAHLAAKMGFTKFNLWDADLVEPHNLPNQTYDAKHIGMSKVKALAEVLLEFNPSISIDLHDEFFTDESELEAIGPVVLTTDTMSSRRDIMNVCENNIMVDYVFETRLGFEHGETAIIDNSDPGSVSNWMNSLINDEDVPDGPCNARICTTLVQLISSYTVHQMCEMYSSRSKDNKWKYNTRTVMQMNPALTVYAM